MSAIEIINQLDVLIWDIQLFNRLVFDCGTVKVQICGTFHITTLCKLISIVF